jgi:DNA-binding NtrC family response regulator
MQQPRILIVDDEEWVRLALSKLLEGGGYLVERVSGGLEAKERMERSTYDMVVVDLRLRDLDGIEVLKTARAQSYEPAVLLITAHGTVESAVEAIKLGAFDYLTKPLDSKRVLLTVKQAIETRGLRLQVSQLRRQMGERYGSRHIVFASSGMKRVMELVELVSRSDSTVLIEGESGTGKELIARAMHYDGSRANEPFVAVNCGALPEPLLESELFGHVRGAFTGAIRDKKGLFEEANRGTLLLDEIGELPVSIQVKLLRVLQDGEIRRVGATATRRVDVRIVACTNSRLFSLVESGRFRKDLFYRLNVIPLVLPPLRERREDVIPLANHFLGMFNRKLSRQVSGFSPAALGTLMEYDWPGNVRELENLVERTVALNSSGKISRAEIDAGLRLGLPPLEEEPEHREMTLQDTYGIMEKERVLTALNQNEWNRTLAARALGISRTSLWRKMKQHDLREQHTVIGPSGTVSEAKHQ